MKWCAFFGMPKTEPRADPVLRALDRKRFVSCFRNSLRASTSVAPLSLVLDLFRAGSPTRSGSRFDGVLQWSLFSPMLVLGVLLGLSAFVI